MNKPDWILPSLFSLKDSAYRDFNCKLLPTVDPETVIGVRTPALRTMARQIAGSAEETAFLSALPHRYYEENNLHGLLINTFRDFDRTVEALSVFLPYVNNWATCDLLSPKAFKKNPVGLIPQIRAWLISEHPYTVRFGIGTLMRFYLDEPLFDKTYPFLVAAVRPTDCPPPPIPAKTAALTGQLSSEIDEYYVQMMMAWYFATALAKQYGTVLPYLKEHRLSPWIHNKTIQKAIESYRIAPAQKEELRALIRRCPISE